METHLASTSETIICPMCHGENPADAVFCGNPNCRKALGEFGFADEIVLTETGRAEKVAAKVASFVGKPHFITAHLLWFALWVFLNSGILMATAAFDVYPYSLLGIILSIEATLITSFLLISNNRQNIYADKRSQLDYEVNVKTFRLISRIAESVAAIEKKLDEQNASAPTSQSRH